MTNRVRVTSGPVKNWHALVIALVLCLAAVGTGIGVALLVEGTAHADHDGPHPIGFAYLYPGVDATPQLTWCVSPSLRYIKGYSYDTSYLMRTDGMPTDDPYECSHYFAPPP